MWKPVDLLGEWQVGIRVSVIAVLLICLPDIVPVVHDSGIVADSFEGIGRLHDGIGTLAGYIACSFKQRFIEIEVIDYAEYQLFIVRVFYEESIGETGGENYFGEHLRLKVCFWL